MTYGSESKLCAGGGELVYHSSVSASQGSLPARRPWRDLITLKTKTRRPRVITYEPIVEIRLYHSHIPPWV